MTSISGPSSPSSASGQPVAQQHQWHERPRKASVARQWPEKHRWLAGGVSSMGSMDGPPEVGVASAERVSTCGPAALAASVAYRTARAAQAASSTRWWSGTGGLSGPSSNMACQWPYQPRYEQPDSLSGPNNLSGLNGLSENIV